MSRVIPYEVAKLRGFPGKRKMRAPPQPSQPEQAPEPPEFLMQEAKIEWLRLASELHALGMLTPMDVTAFATYCQSVGRWLVAERLLAEDTLVVSGSEGSPVINPLVRIVTQAARDVIRFGGEFGLSPSARTKIAAGPPDPPSRFGDLLA